MTTWSTYVAKPLGFCRVTLNTLGATSSVRACVFRSTMVQTRCVWKHRSNTEWLEAVDEWWNNSLEQV